MIELFGILVTLFLILISVKFAGLITWAGVVIGMLIIILVVMFIAVSQDTY